ncbi:succinate dehydrogenase assembly factor 2 [Neisseria sp.]|uniref:FAD assembly factor SdhE n=1 Tax=Neisseria sp. TaxID=192066 RepID=UPI0035A15F33
MVFDDTAKRKIRFQTRRGLLELDIVLGRFMDKEFDRLSDEELAAFAGFLEGQDHDLLAEINGSRSTGDRELDALLEKIRRS